MSDFPLEPNRPLTRKRATYTTLTIDISDDEDHDDDHSFLGRIQQGDAFAEERKILSRGVRRIVHHLRHKRYREAEAIAGAPLDTAQLEPASSGSLMGFHDPEQTPIPVHQPTPTTQSTLARSEVLRAETPASAHRPAWSCARNPRGHSHCDIAV